jgi:DnaJ-class molecular chaperone
MKDYYDILGIDKKASQDEIKKAYRRLSMEHHPDRGGDEDKFKDINEAHSVLSDEEKKREYDNPSPFFNGFPGFGPFGRPKPRKPDLNAPKDGQFIGAEVEIPIKIFVFGGKFKLTLSYHEGCDTCGDKGFENGETCTACNGGGYVEHVQKRPGFMSTSMVPCPACQGLGLTSTDKCGDCNGKGHKFVQGKEFIFDIPPGSGFGSKHLLRGVGRIGRNGGRSGDVGIVVIGLAKPDLNKLNSAQVEELKKLLEALDIE